MRNSACVCVRAHTPHVCMCVWTPVCACVTVCLYPPLCVSVCMHLCHVPTVCGRTVYAPVYVFIHLCVCPPCVPVREHLRAPVCIHTPVYLPLGDSGLVGKSVYVQRDGTALHSLSCAGMKACAVHSPSGKQA